MKTLIILCLALVLTPCFAAKADQEHDYPPDDSLITLTFPDSWDVKVKNGRLYASPAGDSGLFVEVSALESSPEQSEEAIKEAKASIEESFHDVTYDPLQSTEINTLGVNVINAKGVDKEGKANINAVLIVHPKSKRIFMMLAISSQEAFEKHGEVIPKIIESLKPK